MDSHNTGNIYRNMVVWGYSLMYSLRYAEVFTYMCMTGLPYSVYTRCRLLTGGWVWPPGFPSSTCVRLIGISLYYCLANFVLFYLVFIINLVTILGLSINVEFFMLSIVRLFPVMYKISIMSSICPMEWWFSSKCRANFDLLLLYLKSR